MMARFGDGGSNVGAYGVPADPFAVVALVLGLVVLFGPPRRFLLALAPRTFVLGVSVASFLASLAYIHVYLRGGPRIIDATSYYLQGAALSHGELVWTVPAPAESFRGRFLIAPGETSLTGIFPSGYPVLLALAFLLKSPMLLGPLLGAVLTAATYRLARVFARDLPTSSQETVARGAALLSLVCGAVRYHTADTMSHGLSMVLATFAFTEIAKIHGTTTSPDERRTSERRSIAIASFCTSYLAITRFASALPLGLMLIVLVARTRELRRPANLVVAFAFPLAALLVQLHVQHTQTGSYFTPAQSLYYRLSDGPDGCFKYGFGKDVGCLYEHGDFVRSQLPSGYGVFEALKTTGRRLLAHGGDAANASIFLPLALWGAVILPRFRALAAAYALLHVCAYVPFYFDGNYPGGGARFFSELLPLEHVLLAMGVVSLTSHAKHPALALVLPALALVVFGVHGSFAHLTLRDRDGGRPFFAADVLREAGVTEGLVFVDTDHGFNVAHADALHSKLVVARQRGDAFDRLLYDGLGAPRTYRYVREGSVHRVEPFVPAARAIDGVATFEAESFWPPREKTGGYGYPEWSSTFTGASGRVYTFHSGSPIVHLPALAKEVRVRSCTAGATCSFGAWVAVPPDRRLPLENALQTSWEGPLALDQVQVSFPVAPGP